MKDAETTIEEVSLAVLAFTKERNWEQFHNPKDLALALVCEVGEILEHFRYKTNDEIGLGLASPGPHREVSHELADCFWLVLRLSEVCKVDLAHALEEKLALAAIKYPVDKSYGKSHKYTHYQTDASGEG